MKQPKILISGAGIAGLALAIRLDIAGIDYVIVEKKDRMRTNTSGIALPFNAVKLLEHFGCRDVVLEQAHQVKKITYSKPNGKILASSNLNEYPFNDEVFVALTRSKLLDALASNVQKNIHYGTVIENAVQKGSTIHVSFSDNEINDEFDLLISAEGINSLLRQQAFPEEETIVDYGVTNWRFIARSPCHGVNPIYMLGRTDLFMMYPISTDELYCYAHIYDPKKIYTTESKSLENLKLIFQHYANGVPQLLTTLSNEDIVTGRLKSVTRSYLNQGNVIFIGDAGNACSPLLQQGAAGAFEDVMCLSDVLATTPISEVAEAYKLRREEKNTWVLNTSDAPLKKIKATQSFLGSMLRNTMVRKLGPLNVHGWKKLAEDSFS